MTVLKAGRKGRFTCINMITWPVNKEQEKSTDRGPASPLVLYIATTVFPEVNEEEYGILLPF